MVVRQLFALLDQLIECVPRSCQSEVLLQQSRPLRRTLFFLGRARDQLAILLFLPGVLDDKPPGDTSEARAQIPAAAIDFR